jgi:hypothetical protein
MSKASDEKYSEQETAERRDAVLKHMLGKPPQPHSEMKIGKGTGNAAKRRGEKKLAADRLKS